jgi:hypothetical protein
MSVISAMQMADWEDQNYVNHSVVAL